MNLSFTKCLIECRELFEMDQTQRLQPLCKFKTHDLFLFVMPSVSGKDTLALLLHVQLVLLPSHVQLDRGMFLDPDVFAIVGGFLFVVLGRYGSGRWTSG